MEVIKVCAAFLFTMFSLHEVLTKNQHHHHHIPSRRIPEKYREFYCRKAKGCPYGDNKVCGWDEEQPFLAVFDDICTMYRANCRGVGVFFEVSMIVCDTKLSYEKEHVNETFEFIHLRPTVTEPPSTWYPTKSTPKPGLIMRIQRMKLAGDSFSERYCKKAKLCIRGGDVVCAFDKRQQITAMFPDKCIYYAVNCVKQGKYIIIDVNTCSPNITYSAERINVMNGYPLPMFMTYLPSKITKMAQGQKPDFSLLQATEAMEAKKHKGILPFQKSKKMNISKDLPRL